MVFPAGVLEIPDVFLLLGVHRNDGLAPFLEVLRFLVYERELRVAIGMVSSLLRFPVRLERIPHARQFFRHRDVADPFPSRIERVGYLSRALAAPQERALGISPRGRLHLGFYVFRQRGILRCRALSPAALLAHAIPSGSLLSDRFSLGRFGYAFGRAFGTFLFGRFPHSRVDGVLVDSRCPGNEGLPAPSYGHGLGGGPYPPGPLVQERIQDLVLLSNERFH